MRAAATSEAQQADLDYGKGIYERANCVGCHKWHGGGGGGYGGAALSLRATMLDREQMIEAIRCGRPGTGMPYHGRKSYTPAGECFGFTSIDELAGDAPPKARQLLSDRQIEGVVDYVQAQIQGRGEPTKEDCIAFWGATSHNCQDFQ